MNLSVKSEDFEYSAKPYIDHVYDALFSLLELDSINHSCLRRLKKKKTAQTFSQMSSLINY